MTDFTRRSFLITAAAAPAALAALPAAAAAQAVAIQGMAFRPQTLTIAVGDTVTWTNQDGAPHTATFSSGGMDTGRLNRGGSAAITFSRPGTYDYVCAIHPSMRGQIVVTG